MNKTLVNPLFEVGKDLIKPAVFEKTNTATRPTVNEESDKLITPAVFVERPLIKPAVFEGIKANADNIDHESEEKNVVESSPTPNYKVLEFLNKEHLPTHFLKVLRPSLENSIGPAEMLKNVLPEFIFEKATNNYFVWNSMYWEKTSEEELKKFLISTLDNSIKIHIENNTISDYLVKTGNSSSYNGIFKTLAIQNSVSSKKINSAEDVLCLKNGIFSFHDFTLHPFKLYKNNYLTSQINYNYDPNAFSKTLNYFLHSIMGDEENVLFLQKILGYALLGQPDLQIAFILEGSGSNGKSTLISAIQHLLKDLTGVLPV